MRLCLLSMALWSGAAAAHEVRPAIADVAVGARSVELSVRMALEPLVAGIDLASVADTNNAPEAGLHDRLRRMEPAAFEAAFREAWPRIARGFLIETGGTRVAPEIASLAVPAVGNPELPRDSVLTIRADLPPGGEPVTVGWRPNYGQLVLREQGGGEDAYEAFLVGGEVSDPLPRGAAASGGPGAALLRAIGAGVSGIVPRGPDHVLFLIGLCVFSAAVRPLLWQALAFALAVPITLTLAGTGVVAVPARVVEPLIAATVIYVGVETLLNHGALRVRAAILFAFGLLHGLGLAAALDASGLAAGALPGALIGFALGAELGILAVVAAAWGLLVLPFASRDGYRARIAVPASVAISAVGLYLLLARTGVLGLGAT